MTSSFARGLGATGGSKLLSVGGAGVPRRIVPLAARLSSACERAFVVRYPLFLELRCFEWIAEHDLDTAEFIAVGDDWGHFAIAILPDPALRLDLVLVLVCAARERVGHELGHTFPARQKCLQDAANCWRIAP